MTGRSRGFTLIELMIAIVVVAILASIAVASYRSSVLRANRTDGTTTLLQVSAAEEKYFLQNSQYTADLADAPPTGLGLGTTSPRGYYTLAVTAGSTGSLATSWLVTATATGSQTQDLAACQTMSIDDQGNRSPADSSGCWR
jgi:type IV pilus assembly protein PilE